MPKRNRGIIVAKLVAACVVHKLRPDAGLVGVFDIEKRPVSGPGPRCLRCRGRRAVDDRPHVIVECTLTRTPCTTLARWIGGPDERVWVQRFAAARRTGLYLRVVKAGQIIAADTIEVIEVPTDPPTITGVFAGTASRTA